MTTTIHISDETWRRLNKMKEVGDSFDDVICRLLDKVEKNG